ncbi:MAG: putative ABC transporter permease [Oscillospiraceae bacterium]|nr:putative ABC transporter permease [Oscillospiraceae bacterium]
MRKTLSVSLKYAYIFLYGAFIYSAIEVAFRGYTHWSMTLTGGTALVAIYRMNMLMSRKSLLLRCAAGCAVITSMEFTVGCVVNRWLHMGVWDYSHMPLNVLGQICPLFSGAWFLLCIPAIAICMFLHKRIFENTSM